MEKLLQRIRHVKREIKRILRGEVKCTAGTLTETDLIKSLGRDNPLILEVGAHDGRHTEWFLKLFPEAEVHCFEPDPRALKKFRDRINSKRAAVHSLAISDRNGEIDFHVSGGFSPSMSPKDTPEGCDVAGSIRQPKKVLKTQPWCTFDQTITVLTRTLDSWCKENGLADRTIDFIWADVQGAEIDLIRGGPETLQRTRYFFTEYSNNELYEGQVNLKTLLRELPDFEVLARYMDDVFLRNKMKGM